MMRALCRWLALALLGTLALPMVLHAAPPAAAPVEADSAVIQNNQRRIDAMQAQQTQLLEEVRRQLAAMPRFTPAELARNPEARAQEERRLQLAQLLADIEQRVQEEENARPRTRYLSPATLGPIYAPYYTALRRKIEARAAANFPQAEGHKLHGAMMMALRINHDGRLLEARVVESSGNPTLDRLAEDIVRSAAPFDPFTPEMREDAGQIDITTRFDFTHDTAPAQELDRARNG